MVVAHPIQSLRPVGSSNIKPSLPSIHALDPTKNPLSALKRPVQFRKRFVLLLVSDKLVAQRQILSAFCISSAAFSAVVLVVGRRVLLTPAPVATAEAEGKPLFDAP